MITYILIMYICRYSLLLSCFQCMLDYLSVSMVHCTLTWITVYNYITSLELYVNVCVIGLGDLGVQSQLKDFL